MLFILLMLLCKPKTLTIYINLKYLILKAISNTYVNCVRLKILFRLKGWKASVLPLKILYLQLNI